MEKMICIGFFLVLLALGSQSTSEIEGNIRNLINAAGRNDTTRVDMYNQILKQEARKEKEAFGALENQLGDLQRANWRRKAERMFKRQALPNSADNQHDNVKDVFGTPETELGDLQQANWKIERVFKRQASPKVSSNEPRNDDNVKDLADKLKKEEIPEDFEYNAGLNKGAALLLPVISLLREKLGTNQTDLVFGTLETEPGELQLANRKTARVFKREASPKVSPNEPRDDDNVKDLADMLKYEQIPGKFEYNAGLMRAGTILLPLISKLRTNLNRAFEVQLRFVPRALVDKIEEKEEPRYVVAMQSIRERKAALATKLEGYPGQLKHRRNQLKNDKLGETERAEITTELKKLEEEYEDAQVRIPGEIATLTSLLPPTYQGNTRTNRVETRKHLWNWIMDNRKDNLDVARIWKQIRKRYTRKPANYKRLVSLKKYVDLYSEGMGAAHEQVSVTIAHVLLKFHLHDGFEFEFLPIFNDDELDESVTILVNAVGLATLSRSDIENKGDAEIFPGTVIRKID